MRISERGVTEPSQIAISKAAPTIEKAASTEQQMAKISKDIQPTVNPLEDNEETRAKVQEAINTMNSVLKTTNSSSKFMYHEGLDRYYVTVVDKQTEEVVREIPPRKLLDAYYEMQKMLGMIVDEKI